MTIAELKQAIRDLPDDADIVVSVEDTGEEYDIDMVDASGPINLICC